MQQSILKFYCFVVWTLPSMFRALLCPSSGARQTAVAASGFHVNVEMEVFSAVVGLLVPLTNRPRLRTLPPPHSHGNQRPQQLFDGLLMMGIVMPETCWAVSVWQSNKNLRLIVASSWVFYLSRYRHVFYEMWYEPSWSWRLALSTFVWGGPNSRVMCDPPWLS